MRWLCVFALAHSITGLLAQELQPQQPPAPLPQARPEPDTLPDSPGAAQTYHQSVSVRTAAPPPCKSDDPRTAGIVTPNTGPSIKLPPCTPPPDRNPYQRFLNYPGSLVLTPKQKGLLAIHNVIDRNNLFTVVADAGFTIGIDSHTGYGPGFKGFGRNIGYSLVQDATGEFFSTFAIDSLLHQDPHYHRLPNATVPHRLLHAIAHTVISQHDDGRPMPNYSTLLTYPISAEIANLYVPGVSGDAESTVTRIVTGLATDPVDNLVTEFLPDFARRVHIRVVFLQQILNKISSSQPL